MARLTRRLAVSVPVAGLVLLATAAPALAAPAGGGGPPGKPQAPGVTGNPHADGARGDPHKQAPPPPQAGGTTSSAPKATPTMSTPPPPSASTPIMVASAPKTATKVAAPSGGGGKPCNGCVGQGDGKRPPGQERRPGESGHRCDDNKGVGRGNPAHTGCAPPPTPTTPTTTTTTTTTPTLTTTPDDTAVLGTTFTRSTERARSAAVASVVAGSLASTGAGGSVDLSVLALGCIALGVALRWRFRTT